MQNGGSVPVEELQKAEYRIHPFVEKIPSGRVEDHLAVEVVTQVE